MSQNEDLLNIFGEEARDLLDGLTLTVQKWSLDLNNKTCFADLKRDLHTLKGGARMVNQSDLSALAHALESFCEALVQGTLVADREAYDLVCSGLDHMNIMLASALKQEKVTPADALIDQFKQKISKTQITPSVPTEVVKNTTLQNPIPAEPQKSSGTTSEVIRVRSDLLENLNNLSIENNIIRVNLGHYVDNFNTHFSEIGRLLKMLQEKIRMVPKEVNLPINSEMMALTTICKNLLQTHSKMGSLLSQQGRIALELQDKLLDTRMVPFDSVVPRLSRITRQVASEVGKKVVFNVLAGEGEIDRNLLEHLVPSIEHLLRNAIDHGIEPPDIRLKSGKPESGTINLQFFRLGNDAGIEISDDGSGINAEAIKLKAIKLGLLPEGADLLEEEALRYILEPGFSTREDVSEISGRGVGMDVVNTVVKGLGGNLYIETKQGVGTKFIIRMPFTSSMNRALLVVVQGKDYGILLSNVENIVLLTVKQIKEWMNKKTPTLNYNKKEYHLKYLGALLGEQDWPIFANLKPTLPALLFDFPDYKAALLIDSLAGSQEIVVQTLGPQFKLMDTFSGASLLPDGRVIIILDVYSMLARAIKLVEVPEGLEERKELSTVLVVDDSVTIRTVTKNFLERHKYIVFTAKDGLDALEKLKTNKPDIILLDVEMPKMDGFQFVENIKKQAEFSNIPIIMITFCAGDEQRNKASELGIEKFMSKPYQESDLLDSIKSLLDKRYV